MHMFLVFIFFCGSVVYLIYPILNSLSSLHTFLYIMNRITQSSMAKFKRKKNNQFSEPVEM